MEVKNMPAVSVIIPVFNREECIEKTVTDILNQMLDEIEVICIDDGSTDNSLSILQSLASQDDRVRVFQEENQGAGFARNNGIKKAKGEYIFFLDSDDSIYSCNSIKELYESARSNNADVCGGKLYIKKDNDFHLEKITECGSVGFVNFSDYQYDYYFQRFLYKTSFIKSNELVFPKIRLYEDPVFLLNVMMKAKGFYQTDIDVYIYNKCGRTNEVRTYTEVQLLEFLTGLNHNLNIAVNNKLERLQYCSFDVLRNEICPHIETLIPNISKRTLRELMISNSLLDTNILRQFCDIESDYILYPLFLIYNTSKKYYSITNNSVIRKMIGIIRSIKR